MLLAALVLDVWLASGALAQNAVELTPANADVQFGDAVSVDLGIDFSDPSLGGGIVVEYETSRLGFQGFSFDPASPDDPALRLVCPSPAPACQDFPGPGVLVAFAVDTLAFPAISGAHVIGTLQFETLFTGTAPLDTREDDSVAGPLVGVGSFAAPSLGTATVTIAPPPTVPALEEGAAALLALGLAVAGAFALQRSVSGAAAGGRA